MIVVGGLIGFVAILFRQLTSELTKWNSTKTGHMFRSECDLKTHVQNLGYLLSKKKLNIGISYVQFHKRQQPLKLCYKTGESRQILA